MFENNNEQINNRFPRFPGCVVIGPTGPTGPTGPLFYSSLYILNSKVPYNL